MSIYVDKFKKMEVEKIPLSPMLSIILEIKARGVILFTVVVTLILLFTYTYIS